MSRTTFYKKGNNFGAKIETSTILSENQSYFVLKPGSLRIIEGERKLENCSGQISFQDLYEKVKDSRGSLSRVKKGGELQPSL